MDLIPSLVQHKTYTHKFKSLLDRIDSLFEGGEKDTMYGVFGAADKSPDSRMDVFSYLYLPIEHVVNLAAKIEAIYDHTPKFHDQYDNWLDAYEQIMKLSSEVDRWKGTC